MLFTLLTAAALQSAAPDTVVVTGVPLKSLEAEAMRCAKRECTMREDIVASVRYAEGLFRTGRYAEARFRLKQAISRNRSLAKSDPAAMAALYEATATVARHDGDQDVVRNANRDRLELIRATTSPDSPETLAAALDLLDSDAEYGRGYQRVDIHGRYKKLAARARDAGQPALAARATLHQAAVAHGMRKDREAQSLLDGIIHGSDSPAAYRTAARATAARFARENGDIATADALVAEIAAQPADREPLLLWAPPIQTPTDSIDLTHSFDVPVYTVREEDYVTTRCADVGYAIRGDGSVDSVEILRTNRSGEAWAKPVLKAIAARRYAPLGDANALRYKIERWTLTADYDTPKGSNIRRRLINPHYEQLDISTGARPAPAKAP